MFFPFPKLDPFFIRVNTEPDRHGKFLYTKYWLCSYFPGHPEGEHFIRYREQVFQGDDKIQKNFLTNI